MTEQSAKPLYRRGSFWTAVAGVGLAGLAGAGYTVSPGLAAAIDVLIQAIFAG